MLNKNMISFLKLISYFSKEGEGVDLVTLSMTKFFVQENDWPKEPKIFLDIPDDLESVNFPGHPDVYPIPSVFGMIWIDGIGFFHRSEGGSWHGVYFDPLSGIAIRNDGKKINITYNSILDLWVIK